MYSYSGITICDPVEERFYIFWAKSKLTADLHESNGAVANQSIGGIAGHA